MLHEISHGSKIQEFLYRYFSIKKGTVIYTSALIETVDKKFVIGEMNTDTFAPGKLQLVGGGIDSGDINGGIIVLEHSIVKEINEEIGIDAMDTGIVKSFKPFMLKTGGKYNFLSAVYKLDLLINGQQLLDNFHRFNREQVLSGVSPELKSLVLVDADSDSVTGFLDSDTREKDENLAPALKAAVGLVGVRDYTDL